MGKCKSLISSIDNCPGEGNASGIVTSLKIAAFDHVASVPAPTADTYTIATDLVMSLDTRTDAEIAAGSPVAAVPGLFHNFDLKETGLVYTSEPVGDPEDGQVEHKITGKIPKRSAVKSRILDGMGGGREHKVIFTDKNRYTSIMGDNFSGPRVISNETADGNGYNIEIIWLTNRKLYEYTGAIATA